MSNIRALKHQHALASWKQIIASQQASGLTVRSYCSEHSLNYNSFQYWLRQIREELAAAQPAVVTATNPAEAQQPEFAVLASACQVVAKVKAPAPQLFKLHYGQAVLEIPAGTSAADLLPTLQALRTAFPC